MLGVCMLLPIPWSIYYQEHYHFHFLFSALSTSLIGVVLWRFSDSRPGVQIREGFAVVVFGWVTIILFGSLPFMITGTIPGFTDAVFESTSGFTTTGASILQEVESLPKCILFWRSFTHWLGGMSIIVFSIAIMPILGIGGMQLYRVEAPGPVKDKLTPRIQQTARLLWAIYAVLTISETLLLLISGMSLFDALCHSFGTVATGGFSTRNNSIEAFSNPWVHWIIIVFMFLAGTNFALHYRALIGKPQVYLRDPQFRFYAGAILIGIVLVIISSWLRFRITGDTVRDAIFVVLSQSTCTGYTTADYERWHPEAILILIILMFMGGMVGSTSGGLKSMRCMLIIKQIKIEIKKLIHPQAIFTLRFGSNIIPNDITTNILAFSLLYIIIFLISSMLLVAIGIDFSTSFGSSIACLSGVGPGIGLVGPTENYDALPILAKWVLIGDMYMGRLELLTVLAIISRSFWRQ